MWNLERSVYVSVAQDGLQKLVCLCIVMMVMTDYLIVIIIEIVILFNVYMKEYYLQRRV